MEAARARARVGGEGRGVALRYGTQTLLPQLPGTDLELGKEMLAP